MKTGAEVKDRTTTMVFRTIYGREGVTYIMKNKMNKLMSVGLISALAAGMLAGCGSSTGSAESGSSAGSTAASSAASGTSADASESATSSSVASSAANTGVDLFGKKIGVLVADVSGEEALGFRDYYENYLAKQYDVTFTYTDKLSDAASEKSAIEKFASQGYDAVISFSSNDRAQQIETCEENKIYYAIASGMLDDDQYEKYKGDEYFLGQVGPSMDTEFQAGEDMGKFFKDKGVKTVALYGAFIPNPMHVYRTAGVLTGLGLTYGGASDEDGIVGQIFQDQSVDLKKIEGDIKVVSYLQGYGDTTTDEVNAAIQAAPDAFISVGMATTFFAQQLNQAGIEFSDIDSFTQSNADQMKNGKLVYLAGKYSSSIGPVFALVADAISGNVLRDADGNAISVSQNYKVATDADTFDEYFTKDNGDNPIFSKTVLDTIINPDVTFDGFQKAVEAN